MQRGADEEPLDRLSELFASDAILASQFFAMRRSVSVEHRPFRKLMIAVLLDGIDQFLGAGFCRAHPLSRRGRERREAGDWIFDEAAAAPFSFNWLCDGLDIDAGYLRARLARAAAKKAEKSASSKGL
jgi:hypothetical protein